MKVVCLCFTFLFLLVSSQEQCYKFTWVGAVNGKVNDTNCNAITRHKDVPCYSPLVWTDGTNSHNQPDIDAIVNQCKTGQTVSGEKCDPFCTKNDDVCIKMTYYQRDRENTIVNVSSFCGKGVESTDEGAAIKDSCHIQKNVDNTGKDLEVCFCDTGLCNLGFSVHNINLFLIIMAFAAIFLT